jgi:phosphoribosylformylglycinamidine synthase
MVHQVLLCRKDAFRNRDTELASQLRSLLDLQNLQSLLICLRYAIEGLDAGQASLLSDQLLVDSTRDRKLDGLPQHTWNLGVEMHSGQFDQRSNAVQLCGKLLLPDTDMQVRTATFYCFEGTFSELEKARIRAYLINEVESREADERVPDHLFEQAQAPLFPPALDGFCEQQDLKGVLAEYQLAMDEEDLALIQRWFISQDRNPTLTELKVLDTYWSDHCRHTTFLTELDEVVIDDPQIDAIYQMFLSDRTRLGVKKSLTLMELATFAAKVIRAEGGLKQLDKSDEINACSVHIDVDVEGEKVPYLLQFKNETHNHPTEIEPFGGAATCIGGAIRDPLSGRSYVYQGMRLSGSGDPTTALDQTLEGKLAQRTIALGSAHGFSSYGNQIGMATSLVEEFYHPGFVAKHMELGFVIGAVPLAQVRREKPEPSDVVILVGGRTGRDGCGGATGSSKSHGLTSLESCASEVQRGNAPQQRKLQRLMRRAEVTSLIKRCNDFGAGGVSVAIGELADGVMIDLDALPTKYEGLDGTERAISESQERMAMVVAKQDVQEFLRYAEEENLEATVVAQITEEPNLVMHYQGKTLVNLSRELLSSNGAKKRASVHVPRSMDLTAKRALFGEAELDALLSDLNSASKQALAQRFDNTIGGGSVLQSFGGKTQSSPAQVMAALIPVENGRTTSTSLASYGYDPYESEANPFRGAFLAVTHSLAKVAAAGGDLDQTYLTFQEYFGKLGSDPDRWGLPFASLLGAYKAQRLFSTAAIGGKDSMSGTYGSLSVPPTLVSFAVSVAEKQVLGSNHFARAGSSLYLLEAEREEELPSLFRYVSTLVRQKRVRAAYALGWGGLALAVTHMSLGNEIGCILETDLDLARKRYGAFVVETDGPLEGGVLIGRTTAEAEVVFPSCGKDIKSLRSALEAPLSAVYGPMKHEGARVPTLDFVTKKTMKCRYPKAKPRVLIPVFEGTNCELDSRKAWKGVGAEVELLVINTLTPKHVEQSVQRMLTSLQQCQILFLSGGFSASDEPDGSGKFIASFLANPLIKARIEALLAQHDGLVGGICNGFQALVRLGLLPYGSIRKPAAGDPMLLDNQVGHHISRLVNCRVSSTLSPWFGAFKVGDVQLLPVSHGEGRFFAEDSVLADLIRGGQIASQYVDSQGYATTSYPDNPNGSLYAVEALSSADGKVFGRMAHSERMVERLYQNTEAKADSALFWGAVRYFG